MLVGAIVQARMGSTRLPGKALKKAGGKPILWYVVERLKQCRGIDKIVVATSTRKKDDVIEKFCEEHKVECFRGSEDDVLERFYQCAEHHSFDVIVRITADCPLIDAETIDKAIELYKDSKADYVSNVAVRSFPRGLDVEVFSFHALEKAFDEAESGLDREHVTHYIYSKKDRFRIGELRATEKLHRPEMRFCVDTENDFKLVKAIFAEFPDPLVEVGTVIDFIDANPKLAELAKQEEKKYRQGQKVKQVFLQ